ncbi:hypothetical protein LCGC14_0399040 [marine sediment metagenome]|uniref:Uncharacterized protein n=1 Tax=marine sediment metagenome TaxID=412755 RepID=A0A0F9W6B5_9ZZZZ
MEWRFPVFVVGFALNGLGWILMAVTFLYDKR